MKRDLVNKLCGSLLLITVIFPLSARALNPEAADSLHFKLSSDTAFIINTVSSSTDQVAEIAFSVKYDSLWSGTLTNIRIQLSYDDTLLQYEGAYKDSTNWDGDFGVDDTSTSGVLVLSFDQGGVTTFDTSSYTVYAHIQFKLLCQDELNSSDLVMSQNGFNSKITVSTADFYPDSGNWDDGTIISADYQATFAFHDSTFSNSCQDTVILPVYATTNFKTFYLEQWIVYNQEKLEFQAIINEVWSFPPTHDTSRTDTLVTTMFQTSGVPEFNDVPAYRIIFKLLDDLQGDSALISFYPDSSWLQVKACAEISVGETYPDTAVVSLTDSAAYKAVYTGGSVGKENHGDTLDFYLLLKNSFVAGIADGQSADTGVIINVKFGRNLNLSGIDDSTYESVNFLCREQGDSLASIYQTYDAAELNYVEVNNTFDTLLGLNVLFDAGGFVPDWNDRYLHPKFIHTYGDAYGSAVVPDTVGCVEADSVNGQLRFWGADTFDSVEVEMGQFYKTGFSSSTPCTYTDLSVRSTFNLDSFSVRVSVPPTYSCIYSITNLRTGVAATKVNDQTWDIYTTSSFVTIPASEDTLTNVCRINTGLGSCLANKTTVISVTISNSQMWDDIDDEHFVDDDGASGSASCNNGNGCLQCTIGPPDPPMLKQTDENILPTVFALYQNFPNPFNPATTISFDLPVSTDFELIIYNIMGQQVKTFSGHAEAGQVTLNWNASNNSSGVYVYRLIAGDYTESKKMLLLK